MNSERRDPDLAAGPTRSLAHEESTEGPPLPTVGSPGEDHGLATVRTWISQQLRKEGKHSS